MKHLIFIITLFLFTYSYSQGIVFDEDILITKGEKIITDAHKRIENPEEPNCTYMLGAFEIKHYLDREGRLVKTVKKDIYAAALILGVPRIEIFDVNGNIILRKVQDYRDGRIFFLTLFNYDSNSINLLLEEFHLSEDYIYRLVYDHKPGYRKTKKKYYNSKGKRVSSWKRAKRKSQAKILSN